MTKENFCGACVAGITALLGAGAVRTASTGDRKKNKKRKAVIFWVGVAVTIISILIALYILFVKKCQECA